MEELMDQIKEMMESMLENDELIDLGSKLMKKTFDSLVAAGFNGEQAIQIVAHQGFGIKMNQ